MRRLIVILFTLCCILFSDIPILQAAPPRRNQYEDTIGESLWDWTTTLGKSPQEKKTIKAKRRFQRVKKRAEEKARIESAQREKENRRREAEAQKIRNARIKAKQRELDKKRR